MLFFWELVYDSYQRGITQVLASTHQVNNLGWFPNIIFRRVLEIQRSYGIGSYTSDVTSTQSGIN